MQTFVCWNYFKELHNATYNLDLHKAGFVKAQPQIVVCYGTELGTLENTGSPKVMTEIRNFISF
jgi:hypothetical protein